MGNLNRREFIKTSLVAAAGVGITSALPKRAWAEAAGANDTIRVAVIGLGGKRQHTKEGDVFTVDGGKGSHMIKEFNDPEKGAKVVAICDPDSYNVERDLKQFEGSKDVQGYADVRKVLERKDIDAVYIASCNHWHALMTVWACQAGKDVYVEKPVSHNIWEGRKMIEAARKYNRIVQSGTGMRSDSVLRASIKYVQEGNLGKLKLIRAICYRDRPSIGKVSGPQEVPKTVDYELWTGPAEMQPLMRENLHYDWHWIWNYGNGETGDLGAHYIDIGKWGTGQKLPPKRVITVGGRFGEPDDGQTPNTVVTFFDYEPAPLLWENRGLFSAKDNKVLDNFKGVRQGVIFHCENGYVAGGWAYDKDGKKIKQFKHQGDEDHVDNFLKAVKSRKPGDLNAEIEEGHSSVILSHMANISYRVGKQASPDQIKESIKTNSETADAFERMKAHLVANQVDITGKEMVVLGPWLTFDACTEKFTGTMADEANKLVKREYRKPFVLPEKV